MRNGNTLRNNIRCNKFSFQNSCPKGIKKMFLSKLNQKRPFKWVTIRFDSYPFERAKA